MLDDFIRPLTKFVRHVDTHFLTLFHLKFRTTKKEKRKHYERAVLGCIDADRKDQILVVISDLERPKKLKFGRESHWR